MPAATPRVAVVSGANRGLGLAIVRGLAEADFDVILGSRAVGPGEEARESLGELADRVHVVELDVTSRVSIVELMKILHGAFGRCDVLVNNAAVSIDDWLEAADIPMSLVQRTLDTNLLGAWQLSQALIPAMRARRYGRIINVSSRVGQLATMSGDLGAYRVSKAALNALTRIMAAELQGDGILVNAYCPGRVRTDMNSADGRMTPAKAADTAIWLATLPAQGPTGGFFRDRNPLDW